MDGAKPRAWPLPARIAAIESLDDLEGVVEQFARQSGYDPELLSHWDPKLEFQLAIEGLLGPQTLSASRVAYAYSSYLDLNDAPLRSRLAEPGDRGLIATPSGTTSIATAMLYLKNVGVDQVTVITPAYFAVEALCGSLGLAISFRPVERRRSRYALPPTDGIGRGGAIWLTMPVFGASCYVDPVEVAAFIDQLADDVFVVLDESLAFMDRPSLSATRTASRVIRIATPGKALCLNGEKVSFVSAPRDLIDSLSDWTECVAGGIGMSGLRALALLRSTTFADLVAEIRALQATLKQRMLGVLNGISTCDLDEGTDGHFVMLYWPKLPMTFLDHAHDLIGIMTESGAAVIPSSRNRHPDQYGLSFRINLLRLDNAGLGALRRLATALERASQRVS